MSGQVRHYIPSLNLLGPGCLKEIGREARILEGRRAFVVASKGEVGEQQAACVAELLQKVKIDAVNFCSAIPNPTVDVAKRGCALYLEENCDHIVAVGGGSAIDSAKAIGILATNGGDLSDYEGEDKSVHPMPRFIAISTTAGTGSEVTKFAVITDERDHSKFTISDWHMTPSVSVNDPEMMVSMPPSLTAATGLDALTHAVEAYVSVHATPITDGKAYKSIQLAMQNLPKAVQNGRDMDARAGMCYASFLAGTAFNNAGLGLVHAMAHPLGGMYNLPHGLCNALLLPHVTRFNLHAAEPRYAEIALSMGVGRTWHSDRDNAESALKALTSLIREVGVAGGLSKLGVKREDLSKLAKEAMGETIGRTNPRPYTEEQVLAIYGEAF